MSRIGRIPISIPSGVAVTLDGDRLSVRGPKGELARTLPAGFAVRVEDGVARVVPPEDVPSTRARWGLTRALVANMVRGVHEGFEKRLVIEGVGYRAEVEGHTVVLALGFSHPVRVAASDGIAVSITKNVITISGADKELVGLVAARIRACKPPEPYKGKGIRYEGEVVRRKAGKKAVASAK